MRKVTQSKISLWRLLFKYVQSHLIMAIVGMYFLISILIKIYFAIDIQIPCVWKTFFHVECPGCGLTRSFTQIICLDFVGAFKTNPLIFIVMPAGIFYIITDIIKFKRRLQNTHSLKERR